MSIIQTTHQDASTILKSLVREKPPLEVEWPAYADARRQISEHSADRIEQTLSRKRARAMNYLGTAGRFDGSYSKAEPRVFTMQFVSELGHDNAVRRVSRNPWLEGMRQSASDDRSGTNSNVLPFGPQITPYGSVPAKQPS
jgi:hypothetical protein